MLTSWHRDVSKMFTRLIYLEQLGPRNAGSHALQEKRHSKCRRGWPGCIAAAPSSGRERVQNQGAASDDQVEIEIG